MNGLREVDTIKNSPITNLSTRGAYAGDEEKPSRVYVLVGQSNMVGTDAISTFDYIGDDPATAPLLQSMFNEEAKPKTCERVWISSLNGKYRKPGGEGYGKLSPGYGLPNRSRI